MTNLSYTFSDAATMLRRNLVHMKRYPIMLMIVVAMPIVLLLLFVFVLGETLGAGIGGAGGLGGLTGLNGRDEYLKYVIPGILLMAVASGTQGTAIAVAQDMTEGIIARFRTMAISRGAVLAGHVLGSVIQTMLGTAVVVAFALLIGFRTTGSLFDWIAAIGVLTMIAFALTWLSAALGMVSKTVEGASNLPLPLVLLPFFGSGFVPTSSMPGAVSWFAENQPFTPFIETVRGLLMGTPTGNSLLLTIIWCIVISLGGYLWALALYNRSSAR
ncbi:MAG TPA: ABC transporter permease [Chloroflexia bacterium]|nr:ABC transporter permease [Chloroflexia bacterium]